MDERTPYYDAPERQTALCKAAYRWRNTPFRIYNQVPGPQGGVDCILLLEAVNAETGCIPPVDKTVLPRYPEDWSKHHDEELLEAWLERLGLLERSGRVEEFAELRAGDVLVFRPGKSVYHVGQLLDGHFVMHVLKHGPVRFDRMTHPVMSEWFAYGLRPMETEVRP